MKKLLLLLSLFVCITAIAQGPPTPPYTKMAQSYNWTQPGFFSAGLGTPVGCGFPTFYPKQVPMSGAIYYDSCYNAGQGRLYYYQTGSWKAVLDSTRISQLIAAASGGGSTDLTGVRDTLLIHGDTLEDHNDRIIDLDTRKINKAEIVGDVVNETFSGGSLPSGFTSTAGAATINYTGGALNISGGNGNYSNNVVKSTFNSYSNNASFTMDFTVNTKPASESEGLVLSKTGVNNLYVAFKRVTSDSARLTMRVVSGSGNGTIFDSTASIAMADGNNYRIYASISNNTIFFKLSLLTGGFETQTAAKMYRVTTGYIQLPTLGNIGVGVLGGNYSVTNLTQTVYDIKYADVYVLGTSISQQYSVTSFMNHFISNSFKNSQKTFVNAGSSTNDFSQVINAGLQELYLTQPKAVALEMGVNDICANLRTAASIVIDSLQAHGYPVFWIQDFTSTCKDTIIQNICNEKGIPLYAPGKSMTSDMFIDGVHPNDYGSMYMASYLKAAAPQHFGTTGGVDLYSLSGLKEVRLSSPTNGQYLSYNSTLGRWVNSDFPSGSYVQLQTGTPVQQTGSSYVSGVHIATNGFLSGQTTNGFGGAIEVTKNGAGASVMLAMTNTSGTGSNTNSWIYNVGSSGVGGHSNWANSMLIRSGYTNGIVFNNITSGAGYTFENGSTILAYIGTSGTGIGTSSPDASAALDITSTTKGVLFPRMNTTQMNAISSPSTSLMIYNTDSIAICIYSGSAWHKIGTGGGGSVDQSANYSWTGTHTHTQDVTVPGETYGTGWNGSNEVPTKNDTYDKIEALYGTIAALDNFYYKNVGTGDTLSYVQADSLKIKSLKVGSNKLSITPSTNEISFDVNEANLTLGNIGGTLGISKGGTGQTSFSAGYIKSNGSALSSSSTVTGSDVSGNISGNAANVTGTVAVANGGTGATTLTGVLIGNGTSAVTTKTNPSGAFVGTTDAQTLTSKTLTAPVISSIVNTGTQTIPTVTGTLVQYVVSSTTSSGTPAPTGDARDNRYNLTALATAPTFSAPSGTATEGNTLLIRIKDNGTARALTWNAIYRGGTQLALPTTTVISKTMYVQFIYNSADTKWDIIGLTDGL